MKTQKRQVTITDLYNLVAHETVSLLEAVDDNAIPLALEMMNQIWDAFSEATVTENGENRRDLLGKAAVTANELHELTEPQEELEDGRMFMSMDELSAELDEIAHMIARQNNEPQLS